MLAAAFRDQFMQDTEGEKQKIPMQKTRGVWLEIGLERWKGTVLESLPMISWKS